MPKIQKKSRFLFINAPMFFTFLSKWLFGQNMNLLEQCENIASVLYDTSLWKLEDRKCPMWFSVFQSIKSKFPTLLHDNFIERFSLLMYWHLQILKFLLLNKVVFCSRIVLIHFFVLVHFTRNFMLNHGPRNQ